MGEIDDDYKQHVENIDQKLLDVSIERRGIAIEKYRKDLSYFREALVAKYNRKNAWDLKKARKIKPKKMKKEKFKHLKIEHLDLKFNRYEKFKMWWSLFFFKSSRTFRAAVGVIPSWAIYAYYKFVKFVKSSSGDISRTSEKNWERNKEITIKKSVKFWAWLKGIHAKIKGTLLGILSKVMFWKKKGAEGEKKEDGKEEDKKEGEAAGDKEDGKDEAGGEDNEKS